MRSTVETWTPFSRPHIPTESASRTLGYRSEAARSCSGRALLQEPESVFGEFSLMSFGGGPSRPAAATIRTWRVSGPATRHLREEIVPGVKQAPGLVAGYWTRKADSGTSMVVFESEDAANAMAERVP